MLHYNDVIMTTIASQITSLTVVYSTVYSDADQRKHQSSASLAFVRGIHRDRWIPRTKGQLRGKCFHLMTSSCLLDRRLLYWHGHIEASCDHFVLLVRGWCFSLNHESIVWPFKCTVVVAGLSLFLLLVDSVFSPEWNRIYPVTCSTGSN